MLRSFWSRLFQFNTVFGLVVILLFGIPRFIIVLHANITRNYNYLSIIFLLMWISPFIFLTRSGRKYIGMTKSSNYRWLLFSFLTGIAGCTIMYLVAEWCF